VHISRLSSECASSFGDTGGWAGSFIVWKTSWYNQDYEGGFMVGRG